MSRLQKERLKPLLSRVVALTRRATYSSPPCRHETLDPYILLVFHQTSRYSTELET